MITCATMEAKFIAFELARQEAECLKGPLVDMPLWGRQPMTISIL